MNDFKTLAAHFQRIFKILFLGNHEKTIIVSQFTRLLSILQPLLDDQGFTWTRLDGGMNTRERNAVISHFQDTSPESPRVLLLSLRAGKNYSTFKISDVYNFNDYINQNSFHLL